MTDIGIVEMEQVSGGAVGGAKRPLPGFPDFPSPGPTAPQFPQFPQLPPPPSPGPHFPSWGD